MIPHEIRTTLEWLLKIEEYEQARRLVLTVTRHSPANSPEVFDFTAMILHRAKFYREALEFAQKTFSLLPEPAARYNLARCLHSAGEILAAEEQIQMVVQERQDWLDPQLDRAMYLSALGRYDEAEQLLMELQKKIPLQDPHQDVIKFNLAWHKIRHGCLKDGMDSLTMGRQIRTFGSQSPNYPNPQLQKGMQVAGKKILLVGEAGAGDEIINARFAKIIRDRGGVCDWVTQQKMENLFSRVEGIQRVLQPFEVHFSDYDYWASTMDLFSILDLDEEHLLSEPYVTPSPEFVQKWQARLKTVKPFKIGLRWQGNPLYEQDLLRSVPFAHFRQFFSLENCAFFSLQRDTGLDELTTSDPVQDLSQDLVSWEDTAAAISLLDVVVTSCTSIAHLSGALGKKTLLFTPILPYYVWAHPGEKSIWYRDVRLFRQKKPKDWKPQAENIFQELKKICHQT